ncbi:AAA family ATPase [Caldinitratiruptor microaerophilus]|uniref:ATPase n=1 Tax=Caldinitratiruptor microaerophilus TaxID=671077 RepID=A0AA35CHN0_9FIRM|nr:MoxR family ATPase [Caldinitratiruptor microaerophilus]BDG59159.1 ATPase [Caldinitratiruptor microaerophilus]
MQTRTLVEQVVANVERVVVGKRRELEYVLVALLCQGHVLIEDVPGVGKTTLVRAMARSLGCQFRRIQFTPDLLPSDITGVSVWNQATGTFEFRPGPLLAQVVLADEINRTSPRTQSALLEAMEERQVTVDGVTYPLPQPFLVLATQNPIEYEGTFPLPEAQLDRFFIRLQLGYPTPAEEREILRLSHGSPVESLEPVVSPEDILTAQEQVRAVHVDPSLEEYIVTVVHRTREHPDVYLGGSPRGTIALYKASQALALVRGRDFVTPDDVKEMAPLTLGHRLIIRPEAQLQGKTALSVLAELLGTVRVPTGVRRHARNP